MTTMMNAFFKALIFLDSKLWNDHHHHQHDQIKLRKHDPEWSVVVTEPLSPSKLRPRIIKKSIISLKESWTATVNIDKNPQHFDSKQAILHNSKLIISNPWIIIFLALLLSLTIMYIVFSIAFHHPIITMSSSSKIFPFPYLKPRNVAVKQHHSQPQPALRGLGVVLGKGTKSMENLVIANIEEDYDISDFRLFLRYLYRSGTMAKADLVLLFPSSSSSRALLPESDFSSVVKTEREAFMKFLSQESNALNTSINSLEKNLSSSASTTETKPDSDTILKPKKNKIIWGNRLAAPRGSAENGSFSDHIVDDDYGSIVAFHMNELDPANSFSDFLHNPSSNLRRWLCYQMLLGKLRHKFKQILLTEIGGVVVTGDVFSFLNDKKEFLYLNVENSTWADGDKTIHGNKMVEVKVNEDGIKDKSLSKINGAGSTKRKLEAKKPIRALKKHKRQSIVEVVYGKDLWLSLGDWEKERKIVSSKFIIGSIKSAKGLANTMVTEIVRIATRKEHNKVGFPDRILLSYLVQKSPHLLGKKVSESLRVLSNKQSMVGFLDYSMSLHDELNYGTTIKDGQKQLVLQASSGMNNADFGRLVRSRICLDTRSTSMYDDCQKYSFCLMRCH